jgi:hypothetical protein
MSAIMRITDSRHKLDAQLRPEKGGTIPGTELR